VTTLFISDLHLDTQRPDIIQEFVNLLDQAKTSAAALYILGDFVEYWIGDDDPDHGLEAAFDKLRELGGTEPVYLMHGNRDFLIGEEFVNRYRLTLLPDPAVIDLYGQRALLMHGDTLCTDDVEYQAFRKMVRNPQWQAEFLAKPLAERRAIVMNLRKTSKEATEDKPEDIMDVSQRAVEQAMREHDVSLLIHGHTHRPGVHNFVLDGQPATRIVLGDWYQQSSVLYYDETGFTLKSHAGPRIEY
jgi:UDP-2,3-diacylglucosamine hydrolase